VNWGNSNPQFPYPLAAELVISEVSTFNPVDALEHLHFCNRVAQLFQPFQKGISFILVEVVPDNEHYPLSSKNDKIQTW